MDRAEGASFWRIDGDGESNAHDAIEVDGTRVAWEIRPMGSGATSRVEASEPGARRFMSRVLAERRRMVQRNAVRAVPKPAPVRRRRVEALVVECPGCGGEGELGCGCCGGDGWVSLDRAERWQADQP